MGHRYAKSLKINHFRLEICCFLWWNLARLLFSIKRSVKMDSWMGPDKWRRALVFLTVCLRLTPTILEELRLKKVAAVFTNGVHHLRVINSVRGNLLVKFQSECEEEYHYRIFADRVINMWEGWQSHGLHPICYDVNLVPATASEKDHDLTKEC